MPLQKELWSSTLIKNFWKNNSFADKSMKVDKSNIYGGKIVHIPQVNGRPNVTRNRTVFPATIQNRTDGDVFYLIDEHFVDPFRISNAENYELSYDKRLSVVSDQSNAANQNAAEWLLYSWAKYTQVSTAGTITMNAQQLRTNGGAKSSTLSGTTGNRKAGLVDDMRRAKVKLSNADVPLENRFALFDSNMLDEITQDEEYKKAWKIYENELVTGAVAMIQGFTIFERSSALRFTNDATPTIIMPGVASEADTNAGALLWHTNGVENAMGDVAFFQNEGVAEFYGDIYSAILRAGGRIRREDSVIALIQSTAA